MKYIIWGAGKRGEWVLHFLGTENVVAYVDSYKGATEDGYLGKPIITLERVKDEYKDCLLIITPLEGSAMIEQQLIAANFHTYMKLDDCPMSVPCDEQGEYSFYLNYDKSMCYGLAGVNVFTLWLYENMKKNGTDVHMLLSQELDKEISRLLQGEFDFVDEDRLREVSDMIIVSDGDFKGHEYGSKYISDDEFIMGKLSCCSAQILKYQGIHKGERCFIVATGPSLTTDDLNVLHQNKEMCISMNRIFYIFDRTSWRPDYYMIGDREMIEDMSDEIAKLPLGCKFVSTVPENYWNNLDSKDSIPYKMLLRGFVDKMPAFSPYVEKGLYHGTTITYLCMQLAAYMGFGEIYLLGVDFNYSPDVYDPKNHFEGCDTPQNKIRLNPIYPERTLLAYQSAKKYCDKHGIKIFNATRGGKLEVFERVDFDTLFKK